VIARPIVPLPQTLLLDKGTRHGLTLSAVVLDADGVVGRVIDVFPSACLVQLVTDPDSRVAALIERSGETGLLIGRGRGTCELIYLDADADVREGDHVLTAGFGGSFPKGLRLGTVARVVREAEAGMASATVAPAARVGRVEEVLCLPQTAVKSEE